MFLIPIIVLYSLFPLLSIFYPYLILFFECFWRYPSLFFITLFHRYSFKINKFKFFNSNNIYEQPNITISKNGKTYFLHLLDISKPDKKVFIVESDSEYRIYETVKIKKGYINKNYNSFTENENIPRIFRRKPRLIDENRYTSYKIPRFANSENEIHIILITPSFVYSKFYLDKILFDIDRERQIGENFFAKYKSFKKDL